MARRPVLLDLFCGQGGAGMGYHRAGFDVVGVDHRPQPRYPFRFVQADALAYLEAEGQRFDAIHASPPCQRYSRATRGLGDPSRHPDLIGPVRQVLQQIGRPWIIENVPGAPMSPFSVTLCGLMFRLRVFRHRLFEASHLLLVPPHPSHRGKIVGQDGMCCLVGHGRGVVGRRARLRRQAIDPKRLTPGWKADWEKAVEIDWMTRDGLAQAIPPAYTEYLGRQLIRVV